MEESGGQPRKFYQASLPEMAKTMKQLDQPGAAIFLDLLYILQVYKRQSFFELELLAFDQSKDASV